MKARFTKLTFAAIVMAAMFSCGKEGIIVSTQDGIFATISNPVCGNAENTKALTSDFKFSFAEKDQINVFFKAGSTQAMTYTLIPNTVDKSKAQFEATIFAMRDGIYTSVYPSQNIPDDHTDIPLNFSGQAQSGNGTTEHLSAYDYNWAETQITANTGTFSFKHKVVWLKITIKATADNTNFKSLSVTADEGIANSATINGLTGNVTPHRTKGDVLTLSLGSAEGITLNKDNILTAFITVPADKYTNLTISAKDNNDNLYQYSKSGEVTLEAGKYYTLNCPISGKKPQSFTDTEIYGLYSNTNITAEPVFTYDEDSQQMSFGNGLGSLTFKLADVENNQYAIFTIGSGTVSTDQTYLVSADINGKLSAGNFKAIRIDTDTETGCTRVWLENQTNNVGYILAIE